MCVWSDRMIERWALDELGVVPYDPACLNPASLDLRLGSEFIVLQTGERFDVGGSGLIIVPSQALLASTIEVVRMPNDAAGVLYLKSSLARKGADHALAGFCDPGFVGTLTLEIHVHRELRLQPGQRFIQLVMTSMCETPRQVYQGRYQNQSGPTPAREGP